MLNPPTNISGYSPTRDADGFTWDAKAAQKPIDFFKECLKLTSGRCAGKPFELQPWQRDYVATLYGWLRSDGTRRYRESIVFIPRKNGKTELGAGLSLYGLCCDKEQKPEIYSAAKTQEQASRVFEANSIMVRNSRVLNSMCRIIDSRYRIVFPKNNGYFQSLSSEKKTEHGKNPHHVLFDELHAQPDRDLYDGLKTGMGARAQPLFLSLTTAGHDRESICWEVCDYATKVRDGIVPDPHFLPCLYQFEDGDKWDDEDVWKRINPNLGVTISLEFLQEEFKRAKESPAYENTFRNLYLNQWTQAETRWFSSGDWEACGSDSLPDLSGAECWCGLDLSTTTDLSAFAMVFNVDGRFVVLTKYWCPLDSAHRRSTRDRVSYETWIDQGWITATPGTSVDYDRVREDILNLNRHYHLKSIAIDRWNANQLAHQLQDAGLNVAFFGQGYASMSSPAKELEKLVMAREILHDNNPVTRWMANNVMLELDAAGNIKPSKKHSTERIDGIVAIVMGLGVHAADAQTAWTASEMGL